MPRPLRLSNVTKRYGSHTALDRVSFEVPAGCVFALLGENGAGKTTAIRLLLGLVEPDDGFAEVLGLDTRGRQIELLRHVGYVPERPTLYDWMTVAEIGWFTAGFCGATTLRHYDQLISDFGVPADRKIGALQGDARQSGAVAGAAHQPDVLLLDEPTSGLDTMVRREFLESMVDLAAAGRTVLLSSHQIHEVERVADYVAIVHEGRLVLVERLRRIEGQRKGLDRHARRRRVDAARAGRDSRATPQGSPMASPGPGPYGRRRGRLRAPDGRPRSRIRRPSLEEIFVAYMRSGSGLAESAAVRDAVRTEQTRD